MRAVTPAPIHNRPGLDALRYRVGTHGRFLRTMLAELASAPRPALARLHTRDPADLSLALLDGWAVVADILSFYQERIANEGYLRTATERRSVQALARLVGYVPRPGLAATAFLAFTVEAGHELTVPIGSRVQSTPGPGELPQTFETADPLLARGEWNALAVRRTRPQFITAANLPKLPNVVLAVPAGIISLGDILVADLSSKNPQLLSVTAVSTDAAAGTTSVAIAPRSFDATITEGAVVAASFDELRRELLPPSRFGVKKREAAIAQTLIESLSSELPDAPGVVEKLRDLYRSAGTVEMTPLAAWLRLVVEAAETALARPESEPRSEPSEDERSDLGKLVGVLRKPPSLPPASQRELPRRVGVLFRTGSGGLGQLAGVLVPEVKDVLASALAGSVEPDLKPVTFDRMAVRAALFGHNTPLLPKFDSAGNVTGFVDPLDVPQAAEGVRASATYPPKQTLVLDSVYDTIQPGATIALINQELQRPVTFREVTSMSTVSAVGVGISARVTELTLKDSWPSLAEGEKEPAKNTVLRHTLVLAGNEQLVLAQTPVDGVDVRDDLLELAGLYPDLTPGRWVVVTGERSDDAIRNVQRRGDSATGVSGAELAMIASVEHRVARLDDQTVGLGAAKNDEKVPALPGDAVHTFVRLSAPLAYTYRRPTVVVYGNVTRATHGESKVEILGAGDATKSFQTFLLKQPPLTYLPAPTAIGAASTLEVDVNEVRWHEAQDLVAGGPNDHSYLVRIDENGKTAVVFGDGRHGSRPPTGVENIRARYRSGLGRAGNVAAGRINLLISKPLGLKEVVNPVRATGGADREGRDQARRNAPTAVQALDRLVSVQDYDDFTRTFAGIGTASARELSNGRRQLVHVTIAGIGDAPIATTSDLFHNLRRALVDLGDPFEPIEVAVRELRLLVIEAAIRIDPDHRWESVEPALRATLLGAFGADRRELGQDVTVAEVLRAMQAVDGVVYVDLQTLDSLGELELSETDPASALLRRSRVPARLADFDNGPEASVGTIRPAQLVILSPEVPDTLILSELP